MLACGKTNRRKRVPSETLLFDVKDHVALITLNRPDQRNAINQEMASALMACLQQAREDADIRVDNFNVRL